MTSIHLLSAMALTAIILFTATSAESAVVKHQSPNFIIIYADDMGYSDAGPLAANEISTPAIDALATRGQVWTDFYAGASICTPSRAALLTGNLPVRTGLYGNHIGVFFPGSHQGLPHHQPTLAEMFQQNHYATALFGKWHLGDKDIFYPTRHGFDQWMGIPYSNDMDWEVDGITSTTIFDPLDEATEKYSRVAEKIWQQVFNPKIEDWQVPLIRSTLQPDGSFADSLIEKPADQTTITRRYTEESVQFIEQSVKKNKPFFLMLPHSMPHVPLFRSADFNGVSQAGIYGDVIEEIDWSLGEILDTLKQQKIEDNTYLLFTSDNGPWLVYGDHAGSAAPLKNGKGTTFEGGMRTLTLITGPDIKPEMVTDLGMQTDFFASFASLAGLSLPDQVMDSVDLSDRLKGIGPSPRTFIPFYKGSELRAYRLNNHKLHFITAGAYGQPPERKEHQRPWLIDLTTDIGEETNIASENSILVNKIIHHAELFQRSITIEPSLLDRQFSAQKEN